MGCCDLPGPGGWRMSQAFVCPNGHALDGADGVCALCTTVPRTPPPPPPLLPRISGYEILEVIGHGGMGVVYKARHLKLNRLVALKMIRAGAHAEPEQLARFRAEAEAVARLHHPNIVQIFEIGDHDGLPFFALELVEGGSLAQRLAGTPQSPAQAAQLVETLARAVH